MQLAKNLCYTFCRSSYIIKLESGVAANLMRSLGDNIREIRLSKGMTQDVLAEALHVTRQTVSNYETGRSQPDIDSVVRIAQVLEVDINDIICNSTLIGENKSGYKRPLISLSSAILLLFGLVNLWLNCVIKNEKIGKYVALRMINDSILIPIIMFVLGWSIFSFQATVRKTEFPNFKWRKIIRNALLTILTLMAVIQAPYFIWLIMCLAYQVQSLSVRLNFPYIPMYYQLATTMVKISIKVPVIYFAMGGGIGISKAPKFKKTEGK